MILYLNSTFSAEELEKERQVIVQEISMVEDTPDEYIHDLFSESFWPRHPLGFSHPRTPGDDRADEPKPG